MRLLAQKGAAVAGPLMCNCYPFFHALNPDEKGLYLVATHLSFLHFRAGCETGVLFCSMGVLPYYVLCSRW